MVIILIGADSNDINVV